MQVQTLNMHNSSGWYIGWDKASAYDHKGR
jgi:hypothetical protein